MINPAIAYYKQEISANLGAALQYQNYCKSKIEGLSRYYNVTLTHTFIEVPLADTTPLAERKELTAALKYLEDNPTFGLLVIDLNHISRRLEERKEILNLLLKRGYRLLCGQPLIDLSRGADQQELRRDLQRV